MKKIFSVGLMLIMFFAVKAATALSNKTMDLEVNRCNIYTQQRNYEAALNCYRPLAIQGVSGAQFNLGMFYEKGLGVTKDLSAAFQWYQKSAKQGLGFAQAKLGEMYAFGVGTAQNCKQSIYWLHKALKQNNIWAFEDMSRMYENGICLKKDNNKALYWRKKWQTTPALP